DRVVALLTGLPRRAVAALVEAGEVRLTGRAVTNRSQRVAAGDVLEVRVPEPVDPAPAPEPGVEFDVVHADSEVIVVDKPGGLVGHPGSGRPAATLGNGP